MWKKRKYKINHIVHDPCIILQFFYGSLVLVVVTVSINIVYQCIMSPVWLLSAEITLWSGRSSKLSCAKLDVGLILAHTFTFLFFLITRPLILTTDIEKLNSKSSASAALHICWRLSRLVRMCMWDLVDVNLRELLTVKMANVCPDVNNQPLTGGQSCC